MLWNKLFHPQSPVEKRLAELRAAVRASANRDFRIADYERERQLAFRVGELGEAAVGPLCDALEDPDDRMRQYASLALTRVPNAAARVKALVAAASRTPLGNIEETTSGVVALGDAALEPLLLALEADDRNVRLRVSDAIAALGPSIANRLMDALSHPNHTVREAVVSALCRLGDRRVTPSIIKSLADEAEPVRSEAAFGLRRLQDPASVPPLVAALESGANGFFVRLGAAQSLLELGWTPETENQQVLLAVLNLNPVGGRLLKDSASDPVAAITRFGAAAVESLRVALETGNDWVRRDAARALGEIHDERATHALVRAAENDADAQVRHAAKFALDKLRSPSAMELTTSVRGRKSDQMSHETRMAGRNGKCRECGSVVPLSNAHTLHQDWDDVDVHFYFCPNCYVEGDIYTGRLLDRFGDDLIDRVA